MTRIGILGGTFDPPHNGHLVIANEVLTKLGLCEVWFMPNNIPPHKDQNVRVSNEERLTLLSLAILDQPKFKVQPIELQREGRSYTYDTMRLLTDKYKDAMFYFIIGGDMVEYLPHWYNIEALVKLVTFVGVKRPGYSFSCPYPILEVDVPEFDISSTMIRKRLKEKGNTMYLLPERVRQYIEENHLYET